MKKLTLFFIGICCLLCSCSNVDEYDKKMSEAMENALVTAGLSEYVCNKTSDVWHKAITTHFDSHGNRCSDFNQALRVLYEDLSNAGTYDKINDYKKKMNDLSKELSKFPESRKDVYNEFVDMITNVNAFAKLATEPEGSLQSYNQEIRQISNNITKAFDTFKIKYPYLFENSKEE